MRSSVLSALLRGTVSSALVSPADGATSPVSTLEKATDYVSAEEFGGQCGPSLLVLAIVVIDDEPDQLRGRVSPQRILERLKRLGGWISDLEVLATGVEHPPRPLGCDALLDVDDVEVVE